jgi:hypothetical protein
MKHVRFISWREWHEEPPDLKPTDPPVPSYVPSGPITWICNSCGERVSNRHRCTGLGGAEVIMSLGRPGEVRVGESFEEAPVS